MTRKLNIDKVSNDTVDKIAGNKGIAKSRGDGETLLCFTEL